MIYWCSKCCKCVEIADATNLLERKDCPECGTSMLSEKARILMFKPESHCAVCKNKGNFDDICVICKWYPHRKDCFEDYRADIFENFGFCMHCKHGHRGNMSGHCYQFCHNSTIPHNGWEPRDEGN